MRVVVAVMLVLVSILGPASPSTWSRMAAADEGRTGPGSIWPRITPEMRRGIHEWMRGMGIAGPGYHARRVHERPLISMMLMWKDQLGLSPDQERTLRELRTNFEKESIRRNAEIEVAELELNGLLEADKVDLVHVEAQAKKIAVLRAELRVGRIKTIEAGKAVLTPEQSGKLERLGHESMTDDMDMRMMGPGMAPMYPGTR